MIVMAVTELALLRIHPPITAKDSSLLSHLKAAKEAMEKFSGFAFTYYHCLGDPSLILIVGGWPSVEFHMKQWLPSKDNQDLLDLLKDEVSVDWMWHVELEPEARASVEKAKTLAITRHRIKEGHGQDFEKCFKEVKGKLEGFIGGSQFVNGGWRTDRGFVNEGIEDGFKDGVSAEWVLFTGWDSQDAHGAFAKTKEFDEYGRIREFVDSFDVKHGVKMEV